MKHLITTCALALLLAAPAYAQSNNVPRADAAKPAPQGMMMNCPMMADMSGMQKDMGSMMAEMQVMKNDAKDPAMKQKMQKMHERMAVMMTSMQKMGMGGMMGNRMTGSGMMGGQQSGNASPTNPQAAPATPPVSPEDHAAHHPAQ